MRYISCFVFLSVLWACGRSEVYGPRIDIGIVGGGTYTGGGQAGGGTGTGGGFLMGGGQAGGSNTGGGFVVSAPCVEANPIPTLAQLRQQMIGTWRGQMTSPFQGPQSVQFIFRASANYSAANFTGMGPALYYGTDDENPRKKYEVNDIHTNGDGKGIIVVTFNANSGNEGEIDRIRVCNNGQQLDFVFFPTWLGRIGPFEYRLAKEP
jgi:hypothetical protein